jgi:hypothetical protein
MCSLCDRQPAYPLPGRRSYRRALKPLTRRKRSAPTRIHMNRFWNQLEELVDVRQQQLTTAQATTADSWPPHADPDTLACDREVEAVFSRITHEDVLDSEDDLSFTSVDGWTEEEEDVSCYCSAASSCSPSPLPERLPLPLLERQSQLKRLPQEERKGPPLEGRMPLPPSLSETLSLLELLERFNTFRLCTAV